MTTRREFLKGAGTAAAVAVMPVAFPQVAVPAVAAKQLAWSFDIAHGDYSATVIAETADDAHAQMIYEHFDVDLADDCPRRMHGNDDECTAEDCNCQDSGISNVKREPRLDAAAARGDITIEDYYRAGWGYQCARCGDESSEGDWRPIDGMAVCHECTTVDEWRRIDPDRAAELEEDLMTR